MNSTSGFTCFGLVKYNGTGNPTNNQHIFWNGVDTSSSGYGWYIDSSGYLNANWGSYSGMITDLSGFSGGVYHTISSRLSSNSHQLWVDGTLRGSVSKTGSNFTSGVFTLGGKMTTSYGLDGDIQEMIIYSRSLSDTERSAVESYLSMRYQPRTVSTIPQAKALSDGTSVSITSTKVVTVSSGVYSDGSYYIEEPDRFAALRVLGYSGQPSLAVGDRVTLSGVIETADTGERVFVASKVDSIASGEPVGPLGMAGKSLTGNGLLIRVWGRVTEKTSSYLTIDDGSGQARRALIDGLATPITSLPDVGAYISVTGPSGLAAGGVPVVRPTGVQDIRVY
jgi:hypothetical protein